MFFKWIFSLISKNSINFDKLRILNLSVHHISFIQSINKVVEHLIIFPIVVEGFKELILASLRRLLVIWDYIRITSTLVCPPILTPLTAYTCYSSSIFLIFIGVIGLQRIFGMIENYIGVKFHGVTNLPGIKLHFLHPFLLLLEQMISYKDFLSI